MSSAASFLDHEQIARYRALALMGIDVYVLREVSQKHSSGASINSASRVRLSMQAIELDVSSPQNVVWLGLLRHLRLTLGLEEEEICVNAKSPSGLRLCFGPSSDADESLVRLPPLSDLSRQPQLKRQVWGTLKKIIQSDLL